VFDMIADLHFVAQDSQGPGQGFDALGPVDHDRYYDRWHVYWNATSLNPADTGYTFEITNETGVRFWSANRNVPFGATDDRNVHYVLNGSASLPPPVGHYSMRLSTQLPAETQGGWHVVILGERDPYDKIVNTTSAK